MVSVAQIITGKWKENCYVVENDKKQALIIDPGDDTEKINGHITEKSLNPLAIINTHAHYDHIGAVEPLKKIYQIPFYLHSLERSNLKNANLFINMIDKSDPIRIPSVDFFIDDAGNPMKIGGFEINVIFTPGHSAGSVCFQIENLLFTGDLLYKTKIGRTDFPGAKMSVLKNSLLIISRLPRNIEIFPGHGQPTTLNDALINNPEFIGALQ